MLCKFSVTDWAASG